MKDIPRNELLDKLAAGWKVRREIWNEHDTFSVNGGSVVFLEWQDMVHANDWMGEPPDPKKLFSGASIIEAIILRDQSSEKAFVRRSDWEKHRRVSENVFNLVRNDIMAKDWEVWG
jgi:hypothetical protein